MDNSDTKLNRREFLQKTAVVAAGSAALSPTALSYSRIAGANDRIAVAQVGVGDRGGELQGMVGALKDSKNVGNGRRLRSLDRESREGGCRESETVRKGAGCVSPPG